MAAMRVGVLHALRGLDLAEQRGALVGGVELVADRAGAIAVVRDLQRDAALAGRMILHRIEDVAGLLDVADHRQHQPSAPMSMARAMWWYSFDGTRTIAGRSAASK